MRSTSRLRLVRQPELGVPDGLWDHQLGAELEDWNLAARGG
jgi:hypothetical protein